jgi:CBS domain containing-hemolysin-like protein
MNSTPRKRSPSSKEGDSYRVEGDVLLEKLNEMLGLTLPTKEIDTIGGLILGQLGRPRSRRCA